MVETKKSIAGFILAGGQSRRMGRDKSQLSLRGKSFVEHIAAEISEVTEGDVTVVGLNPDYETSRARIADIHPNLGALGGIHTALENCRAEWCLVVACDFPFLTSGLLRRLSQLRDGYDAVAPVQPDGIPQPLTALYRVESCRARAAELIETPERKPIALLQSVSTRWVGFSELKDLPGAENFFDNINTPQDYDRIMRKEP